MMEMLSLLFPGDKGKGKHYPMPSRLFNLPYGTSSLTSQKTHLWRTDIFPQRTLHACSVAKSCLTFWDPMNCSQTGSPVHGILQARILEWILPFPPPKDLPNPGIELTSRALAGRFFLTEPPGKSPEDTSTWQTTPMSMTISEVSSTKTFIWAKRCHFELLPCFLIFISYASLSFHVFSFVPLFFFLISIYLVVSRLNCGTWGSLIFFVGMWDLVPWPWDWTQAHYLGSAAFGPVGKSLYLSS